ncbi:right-handed parallel beta-helix repeat-containing protein [Gammaproteobacteria bacterium]|nr:right-handed parallel beta-helix repeat-containing protein [Gammaproteobacteria bacterium]
MHKIYIKFLLFFSLALNQNLFSSDIFLEPSVNSQEEIQEALILANSGDTLKLGKGTYYFEDGLSLDIDNVTIEGAGMNETVLNFSKQVSGAQGLLVTSNQVTLKGFSVENAKGDAIKVIGAKGIYMVDVKTEWTGGPKSSNGAYGFYPVESSDVLIDGCVAIGASDAGIYVGQSKNIIVRNSIAQYNVAGIEIENSYYADVYENLASHNTAGILVFDLPDLPQQGGHHVRVFRNKSVDNDTDNFAPEGNIVGEVPRGTGIIIQANSDIEVFDNDIGGNGTVNLAIVSYGYDTEDENYYPHPRSVQVHNNRFGRSGFNPDLETGELAAMLYELSGGVMPDIFWDGILPFSQMIFGQPDDEKVILGDNGEASFLTISPIKYMIGLDPVNTDYDSFRGPIKPLEAVSIEGI